MFKKSKGTSILGLWTAVVMVFSLLAVANVSAQPTTYTITVTQTSNGKITEFGKTALAGDVIVQPGATKKFTITPNLNYHIDSILIEGVPIDMESDPNLTWNVTNKKIAYYKFVNVMDNHTIEASFVIDTKKLTISPKGAPLSDPGTGTVSSDIAGIDCGLDCTEDYDRGTVVQLTVAPDAGSRFMGWFVGTTKVAPATTTTYTVTMNKPQNLTVKFAKTYTLTTATDGGDGTGAVKQALVSGTSFGGGLYKAGSVVTLTGTPTLNSRFVEWTGDATGTAKTFRLTMDGDKSVTATFNLKATALQMPQKVKVVDATGGVSAPRPSGLTLRAGLLGALPEIPLDSDYYNDQADVYVEEESTQTFDTINEILCKIGQSKYDEMLNLGPYKAQIDKNLCSSGKDDPSGAGGGSQDQSSGSTKPDYEMWTVVSSRADDDSPQTVKVWIHQPKKEYDPAMLIYAKAEITEGVSDTNPFGLFKINFKGSPVLNDTVFDFTLMKGFLNAELNTDPLNPGTLLKFTSKFDTTTVPPPYNKEVPPMTWIDKATLNRAPDGSTGTGTAYLYEYNNFGEGPYEDEITFDLAYEPSFFLKRDRGDLDLPEETGDDVDSCLDRNDSVESVWSYGLYYSDETPEHTVGSKVNRKSGFPIKFTNPTTGKTYYGWVGYWGIWFPKDVTIKNGTTVTKFEYSDEGATGKNYTVLKSGGKLKKHTKKPLTLGEIKNVPLDYYLQSGEGPGINYRAKWNATDFEIIAKLNQETNMWGPLSVEDPTTIDLGSLTYDTLFLYSQALNGSVKVKLNCPGAYPDLLCTADDTAPVYVYVEDIVYPSDVVPETLACYSNCPDQAKMNGTPFDPMPYDNTYSGVWPAPPSLDVGVYYTFDSSNMVLRDGTDTAVTTRNEGYQFGVMSGPLFEPTPENLSLMACDWSADQTCGWQAWNNLDEYYTWETGPNDWNQFTALKDPDTLEFEKFDPPLQVKYVHYWDPVGDPTNTSLFYLEYSGFGNLWGIPGHCVDRDSGAEVECGDGTRWIPQFSIPDTDPITLSPSSVTDAVDGTTLYYVKALQKEQMMKQTDGANCSGLTITPYGLPNLSEFVDPNIGTEPAVSGPPKVIGGVVQ